MMRRSAAWVVGAAVVALGGCGLKTRPATFGGANTPMLKEMVTQLKAKNKAKVDNAVRLLLGREQSDAEEKDAFQRIKDMVDKDDWDGALKYAESCQAASK